MARVLYTLIAREKSAVSSLIFFPPGTCADDSPQARHPRSMISGISRHAYVLSIALASTRAIDRLVCDADWRWLQPQSKAG